MIVNLLATLKSKGLIICIILMTLLANTYLSARAYKKELAEVSEKLIKHAVLNESLSKENLRLVKELDEKPNSYVEVVKDVSNQVCDGKISQTLIESLPSNGGTVNAKDQTVDIDARLPDDLIRLLK